MNNKIPVLQLFYTFDIEAGGGGLTKFAIELGKNLNPNQFEVIFCSLGYFDSPLGQQRIIELNSSGYQAFEATRWDVDHPYQSFLQANLSLERWIANRVIQPIIHSHSEYTDINAALLKLHRWSTPILRTVHYGFRHEWIGKPLRQLIFTNILFPLVYDLEIGINKFNTDRLNRRYLARFLHRKARRIYNAISLEPFQAVFVDTSQKKSSLNIPADALVVGSVGRLSDQKGYTYLLDAAEQVLRDRPDIYFLIIGDGPLYEELNNKARQLQINEHVILTGSRKDVPELLHCMDLFVSSSLWEGLPTVILEAMACNVPVVATEIPGTDELVENEVNGLVVKPADGRSLGEAILRLLAEPNLANTLARSANEIVQHFRIQHIAQEYEQIYRKLAGKPAV
jgi:glycosyltransferase involved in cell wall biosynthesis